MVYGQHLTAHYLHQRNGIFFSKARGGGGSSMTDNCKVNMAPAEYAMEWTLIVNVTAYIILRRMT